MRGALLNVATVLAGGTAGLLLNRKLPDSIQRVSLRVLGVVTLGLGASMLWRGGQPLLVLTALALGIFTGHTVGIQHGLDRLAGWVSVRLRSEKNSGRLAEGFVTTSLLFCVGPMTLLGSIQDGLTGDFRLIGIKAMMDGVAAMVFASVLGWGVLCSAGTVLVVQGLITLSAQTLSNAMTEAMMNGLNATGGALVLGIGLNLLGWRRWPVADGLPALGYALWLVWWWGV